MEQDDEDGWGEELGTEEVNAISLKRKQSDPIEDNRVTKKVCVKMEMGAGDSNSSQEKSVETACSEKS